MKIRWIITASSIPILLFFSSASPSLNAQSPAAPQEVKSDGGWYVSVLRHSMTDFPLTMKPFSWSYYKSRATSLGVAVGGLSKMGKSGYGAFELGFSMPRFTDPQVTNKRFYFIDLLVLHLGLSTWPQNNDFWFAFYGIFGISLAFHTEDKDQWNQPSYYQATSDGYGSVGLGAKVSPLRGFILSIEYKAMVASHEKMEKVDEGPGWIELRGTGASEFESIGSRLSVGISYIFHFE